MLHDPAQRLLDRAGAYQRTARMAFDNGDLAPAFENARTAAELAAKAMLVHAGVRYGDDHNVAGALVRQGLWPKRQGGALSDLLRKYTLGVYGIHKPLGATHVEKAIRLADEVFRSATVRLGR